MMSDDSSNDKKADGWSLNNNEQSQAAKQQQQHQQQQQEGTIAGRWSRTTVATSVRQGGDDDDDEKARRPPDAVLMVDAASQHRTTSSNAEDATSKSSSSSSGDGSALLETAKSTQQQHVVVTPHMERLLRLLHDGDEEAAAAAAAQLTLLTGQSSPVVLWEILGRLLHTLLRRRSNETSATLNSWKSRQNAATAMQGIARHLPIMDQVDFMRSSSSQKEVVVVASRSNSNTNAVLPVKNSLSNGSTAPPENNNSAVSTAMMTKETIPAAADAQVSAYQHLQLSELEARMDRVLTEGRFLYATAANRYNAQQEEFEDQAVENLSTRQQQQQQQDFVQERTRLQRQILAQRLGLGAISRAVGGADDSLLLPDGITSEAVQSMDSIRSSSRQDASKETTGTSLSRKRRRLYSSNATESSSSDSDQRVGDIRALLVTEIKQEHNKSGGGSNYLVSSDADGDVADAAPSHRNPQQLLASELIYRMFDSTWQVRHGALLGTLAILQAWRRTATATATGYPANDNLDDDDENQQVVFGSWPEDILVRCLCILALDRFGDFSGTAAATSTAAAAAPDGTQQMERTPQGGVVAPVRDTAAQLLSVLWTMAPLDMQKRALDILYRLAQYNGGSSNGSDDWEVRHGALVALKFVTVVIVEGMMRESQQKNNNQKWCQECLGNIVQVAVGHLRDESDDVVSVAAQTLFEIVRGQVDDNSTQQQVGATSVVCSAGEIIKPLWSAMRAAKAYSSSIVDLVALFPVLLKMDSATVLHAIGQSSSASCAIGEIVSFLLGFLDSEFESVQVSALKSVGILSEQLATMAKGRTTFNEAYCLIADRLFAMHFSLPWQSRRTKDAVDSLESLEHQLVTTWKRICDISSRAFDAQNDAARKLQIKLLTRYFGCLDAAPTTNYFDRLLRACDALVCYLSSTDLSNASSSLIDLCLCSFLSSPWLSLCEASCLLYGGLRTRLGNHPALATCYRSILASLLQSTPLCIEIASSEAGLDTLKDDSVIKVCNDSFLEACAMVEDGDAPEDASHYVIDLWKEAFRSRGIKTEGTAEKVVDLHSMRLRATMAHAVVIGGLPSKITPLVRSLMTSLKSEACESRQIQTCASIAKLLLKFDGELKYSAAYSKIMGTVCDMAVEEIPAGESREVQPATRVLHLYVNRMTDRMLQDESNPLLSRLARISSETDCIQASDSAVAIVYAANLLLALSSGLVTGNASSSYFVDNYTTPLSSLSCHLPDEKARHAALLGVKYLCHADPQRGLQKALSTAVQQLNGCGSSDFRLESFRLLKAIVEEAGMDLCPYIRSLLPLVMSLMTDPDEENARMANNMFASLVRLAPLIRSHKPLFEEEVADHHSESVIDHLILGKPLPLCNIPRRILEELRSAGVSLRGYQKEGISWMVFLQSVKLNGALCDSMGLGKTLMALVAMAISHSNQPEDSRPVSLVVCPSTLVGHWVSEIERFFPRGNVFRPLGLSHSRGIQRELSSKKDCSTWNVVVTSYALLRSNVDSFANQDWTYCILDEGHLLRNPKTATARASRRLRGQHKLILTGTPVQNSVNDLWATFDFLMPNFLGSSAFFTRHYAGPITKSQLPGANASSISVGMEKLKILHQQVLPFILRREKEQVLKELPPKNIMDITCQLSEQQARIYQAFLSGSEAQQSITALNRYLSDISSTETDAHRKSPALGSEVLKSLLFMRLLCTHPILVQKGCRLSVSSEAQSALLSASGKLQALSDLLRDSGICNDTLTAADNDTSLLYCTEDTEQAESADSITESTDRVPLSATSNSESSRAGHRSKCLIFAQFSQSLDVLETLLFKPHMPSLRYLRLDGRVAADKRTLVADRFNRDPSISVLLLTTRVGSLGLNLTGADTVVFIEHDYNPFADLQAMDRAHRLGQSKTVNVYRLIMKDTIEEKIMELQRKKVAVSNAIVNSDNSSMYSMGTDRLLDIFTFRSGQEGATKQKEEGGYDLDALMERYGEDYATLSVDEFVRNLRNLADQKGSRTEV